MSDQNGERPAEKNGNGRSLNVFFDVDNTLIMWNGKLRNHTEHVFQQLKDAGHTIYVWSGVGIRRWDMKRHNLDQYVTDYFIKPLERHHEKLDALAGTPDLIQHPILTTGKGTNVGFNKAAWEKIL